MDEQCTASEAESGNGAPRVKMQALREGTSQFDDYLHRGPFLADMPLYVYIARVDRTF